MRVTNKEIPKTAVSKSMVGKYHFNKISYNDLPPVKIRNDQREITAALSLAAFRPGLSVRFARWKAVRLGKPICRYAEFS